MIDPDFIATPLRVTDWIVTAFEGGSNYWIDFAEYLNKELATKLSNEHGVVPYSFNEYWESGSQMKITTIDQDEIIIDYNIISDAIDNDCIHPEIRMRLLTDEYDADDADIILQVACFKEIIYG